MFFRRCKAKEDQGTRSGARLSTGFVSQSRKVAPQRPEADREFQSCTRRAAKLPRTRAKWRQSKRGCRSVTFSTGSKSVEENSATKQGDPTGKLKPAVRGD